MSSTTAAEPGPHVNGAVGTAVPPPARPRVVLATLAQEYADAHARPDATFWSRVAQFGVQQGHHGQLVDAFFCPTSAASVIHTTGKERRFVRLWSAEVSALHLCFPSTTPAWLVELLHKTHNLSLEIRQSRVLLPPDRRICMEKLFTLMKELLQLAEQWPASPAPAPNADRSGPLPAGVVALRKLYEGEVARTQERYVRAAERHAETTYFLGMLVGGVVLGALALAVHRMAGGTQMAVREEALLIVALVVGGLGAIVSVMQRMTSGNLTLRYRAGVLTIVFVGAFRPLIGAIFGLLLYVLTVSGLLPLKLPAEAPPDTTLVNDAVLYFFAALAFFAGFSERFAQDMLVTGQRQLSATGTVTDPGRSEGPPRQ
jgi:hypothetical protein